MTLRDAREGIRQVIAKSGMHAYRNWPAKFQTPAAWPKPSTWRYGETYDGGSNWIFDIVIALAPGTVEDTQDQLDLLIEEDTGKSLIKAFEEDPTLGGRVQSAVIVSGGDYGPAEINGGEYISATLQLEVNL